MTEIITCPACQRKLQVPESFLGQTVQCPECKHQFVAAATTSGVQSTPPAAAPQPKWEAPAETEPGAARKSYEQDDADAFDEPESFRRPGLPHRGGAILAYGILSVVLCGIIFGPIAWSMGSTDLEEIRVGRMDRAGEGLTQAGRILGMVGTFVGVMQVLSTCGFFALFVGSFH